MGEQWSPQTAPAIQAEIPMIMISLFMSPPKTATTIGMRIPKVPQEVPVENARNAATAKMTAGSKFRCGYLYNKQRKCRYERGPYHELTCEGDVGIHLLRHRH